MRSRRGRGSLWMCLICIILASGTVGTTAWSKYGTRRDGRGEGYIARLAADYSEFTIAPDQLPKRPGESVPVEFSVANFSEGKVCETALDYKITVLTAGNLPLDFYLERSPSDGSADSDWIADGNLTGNTPSQAGHFKQETQAVHQYRIRISWPTATGENGDDSDYAGELDYVKIHIHAEQQAAAG